MVTGSPTPLPEEKTQVASESAPVLSQEETTVSEPPASAPDLTSSAELDPNQAHPPLELGAPVELQVKGKGQLDSNRVQNPHDPEATYAVKGQGEQKKEHIGYKVQVSETVGQETLALGEPTRNFLVGIVTHPAYQSDELGREKMQQEQALMGLAKPPVEYLDGAYISGKELVQARAEGRELIGPVQPAPQKDGRFSAAEFNVEVEQRRATCPAGKVSTQCSRLEEQDTGKVNYRFEWSTHCHDCPKAGQCLGKEQRHRTLLVGQYHTAVQARRQEQQTAAFQQQAKNRNAIEGTQSELVRGHGLRRARSRGLGKVKLQNYFIGAACNVKRWLRREAWTIRQALLVAAGQAQATTPD